MEILLLSLLSRMSLYCISLAYTNSFDHTITFLPDAVSNGGDRRMERKKNTQE